MGGRVPKEIMKYLLSAESTKVDVAGEGDHVLDQGGGGPAVQAADGNSI